MATRFSPKLIKTVVIMAPILRSNCDHDMILVKVSNQTN